MAMTIPTLCILPMRSQSHRLPGKMLLPFGGESIAARGWRLACEAFGAENCVVAIMASDLTMFGEAVRIGATIFEYDGPANDLLGRFHACAHSYRWHPDSIIFRWTSDDVFKSTVACRRVAAGERLPVEIGGEAFTLAMLDSAMVRPRTSLMSDVTLGGSETRREHITYALFDTLPPPAPAGCWTVDTEADYDTALARLESEADGVERATWRNIDPLIVNQTLFRAPHE